MEDGLFDYSPARKAHSTIGFALTVIILLASVLQVLWFLLPGEDSWMVNSSWGYWLGSFLPLYLVALPIGLLLLKRLPAQTPEDHKLPGSAFWVLIPVCFFLMYTGNLLGTILSMILSGGNAENAVLDYAMDTNPIKVLFLVILAPLLEEYLCRKVIIDRTRRYGEKVAVVFSAMVFGLLHQNFFQFFYAFALGLVFAYVYIRTGRLRYSVLLHGLINFMGGVLAPLLLSMVENTGSVNLDANTSEEAILEAYRTVLPAMMLNTLYSLALIGLSIAGLVLLIVHRKKLLWKEAEYQLPGRRVRTVYLNAGMIVYLLLCAGSFALALF